MRRGARALGHAVTVVGPAHAVRAGRRGGRRRLRRGPHPRRRPARLRPPAARLGPPPRAGLLWAHGLLPAVATAGHRRRLVHLHQDPRGTAQRAAYRVARVGAAAIVVPSAAMAARLPGATSVPNWTDPSPDRGGVRGGRDRPEPAVRRVPRPALAGQGARRPRPGGPADRSAPAWRACSWPVTAGTFPLRRPKPSAPPWRRSVTASRCVGHVDARGLLRPGRRRRLPERLGRAVRPGRRRGDGRRVSRSWSATPARSPRWPAVTTPGWHARTTPRR